MRIAILAAGSRGDVQPVAVLGHELVRRGHEVVVAVNSDLAGWLERAGLEVVPTGVDTNRFLTSDEARTALARGRIGTIIQRIARDERRVNDVISKACIRAADGADVVLSTLTMCLRGLCLEQATGVPSRILYPFPVHPSAAFASMLSGVRDLRLPWANRASAHALNLVFWAQHRANAHDMSAMLGAPRVRWPLVHGDRPGLHLYSPHVAPVGSDLPAGHRAVGWPVVPADLRARLGEGCVPEELDRWIDAGPAPVYFGFGSMPVLEPERTLRDVAEVTRRRGLRALVAAGWSDLGRYSAGLPEHVFLEPAALDHDRLLPRCRAAVHHGGSGTTGTALRAGLPSVVASVFVDQPFWGWRLERLGVGATLPFRTLTPDRLGAALDRVLAPSYRARAQTLGAVVRRENAVGASADEIERWAGARRPAGSGRR